MGYIGYNILQINDFLFFIRLCLMIIYASVYKLLLY